MSTFHSVFEETVQINTGLGEIVGTLGCPERAWGAVIFADGCGSAGHPLRDPSLAESLQQLGLATLEVDLLRLAGENNERSIATRSFDFRLMSGRLQAATDWVNRNCDGIDGEFRIGYVGTSLGAAAAMRAAAQRSDVAAVVSCGGRPDMAGGELRRVKAATLLIVDDHEMLIEANRLAYDQLTRAYRREVVVLHAHANDTDGMLDEASELMRRWFVRYLGAAANRVRRGR